MISCRISIPNPLSHLLHLSATFDLVPKGTQDFSLAKWRPGRYELASFADNILDFRVTNEKGFPLPWQKTASNTWSVNNPADQTITLHYTYYAYKMDAGNSWVDETQVYINFINCIFFQKQTNEQPYHIDLDLPKDYKIACSLGTNIALEAESFYQLADSPLIASKSLNILTYTVAEHLFYICFMGDHPLDEQQVLADFESFTRRQIEAMGDYPAPEYYFLIQSLNYKHYHGVEHQNSTVLVLGPNDDTNKETYKENLLGVASHELFHIWNICRIRPKEMSPYNLTKETIFETGFVAEGFTTYYGDLFLKQSGVFSTTDYYKEINTLLQRHFQNYGRFESSLIESSRNLWVDGYKKSIPAKEVSIYVKGALVALILDIQILHFTTQKSSLLDVIHQLYDRYTYDQGGYSKADVYQVLAMTGGETLLSLAKTLLETTTPLESILSETLELIGCNITPQQHKIDFTAKTGVALEEKQIIEITKDSPAYSLLSIGDTVLQINGEDFNSETVLQEGVVQLEIKRNSIRQTISIPINNSRYFGFYRIEDQESPSDTQISMKKSWLKT
ncbi:hypothetical protein KO507_09020 [Gilvimarinus agarilyticus]|uniref:M61 family metallopeptidase n=1 Tax=Reichenbachiella agariperforans TaxID=156994 RepID=UPI001C087A6F|nr:hypothetical protein [Reichenbachiella agariperforans]MBU2885900.1 hypothetical protein [Gilvimarinus agarilyticus]MBU2915283.1 M61 family peptidase [Reichenbachiella agariperforans]